MIIDPKSLSQNKEQEMGVTDKAKKLANEAEKQQIFLLSSEKEDLLGQINNTPSEDQSLPDNISSYNKPQSKGDAADIRISEIDKSLKEIYSNILKREADKKMAPVEQKVADIVISKPDSSQNNPPATKLNPTNAKGEDEQRKKFMEDIESWAKSQD